MCWAIPRKLLLKYASTTSMTPHSATPIQTRARAVEAINSPIMSHAGMARKINSHEYPKRTARPAGRRGGVWGSVDMVTFSLLLMDGERRGFANIAGLHQGLGAGGGDSDHQEHLDTFYQSAGPCIASNWDTTNVGLHVE